MRRESMRRRTAGLWVGGSVQGDVDSEQDATVERDNLLRKKARVKRQMPTRWSLSSIEVNLLCFCTRTLRLRHGRVCPSGLGDDENRSSDNYISSTISRFPPPPAPRS